MSRIVGFYNLSDAFDDRLFVYRVVIVFIWTNFNNFLFIFMRMVGVFVDFPVNNYRFSESSNKRIKLI
ncbi:hypothetical protein D3C81_1734750 [compost metagenome]